MRLFNLSVGSLLLQIFGREAWVMLLLLDLIAVELLVSFGH